MPELFREFRQLETGDGKRYAGTGIGLALSRRFARALGGEIEVESTDGHGSTFTLVLPRVATCSSARFDDRRDDQRALVTMTNDAPRESLSADSGDILVVDDFPDTLALYEALLSDDGHRVRTAQSGVDGARDGRRARAGDRAARRVDARHGRFRGPAVTSRATERRPLRLHAHRCAARALTPSIRPSRRRRRISHEAHRRPRAHRAHARRARIFHRLKRQLEGQRRDHIAMLVHDLRHPLASLRLIAEILDSRRSQRRRAARRRRDHPLAVSRHGASRRRRARCEPARSRRVLGVAPPSHGGEIVDPSLPRIHRSPRAVASLEFMPDLDAHLPPIRRSSGKPSTIFSQTR